MANKYDELSDIIQKRKAVYAFLKRVYEKELPKELLAEMPQKMKPLLAINDVLTDAETKKVVKELIQFTDSIGSKDLGELETMVAADYARLFLSINKIPPHPSESIYREGVMMQNSRDEVLKTYWSFGIDKKKDYTEPEDHIAVELSFMEYLCGKAIEELKKGNNTEAEKYISGQEDFLNNHMRKWVPKLVKDVLEAGKTPLYKAIAVLTDKYTEMDVAATKDLLAELRG